MEDPWLVVPELCNAESCILNNQAFEQPLRTKVSVAGHRNSRAATKRPNRVLRFKDAAAETQDAAKNPPIRDYSPRIGEFSVEEDCVMGLKGLELRTKQAVLSTRLSLRHVTSFPRPGRWQHSTGKSAPVEISTDATAR